MPMCGAAETFVIPGAARAASGIRGGESHWGELRIRRQLCTHRHLHFSICSKSCLIPSPRSLLNCTLLPSCFSDRCKMHLLKLENSIIFQVVLFLPETACILLRLFFCTSSVVRVRSLKAKLQRVFRLWANLLRIIHRKVQVSLGICMRVFFFERMACVFF